MDQPNRWQLQSPIMSSDCDMSILWDLEDLVREAGIADLPPPHTNQHFFQTLTQSVPIPVIPGSRRNDMFSTIPEMMDSAVVSPETDLQPDTGVGLGTGFWDRSCTEMDSLAIQDPLMQANKDPTLAELNLGDSMLDYVPISEMEMVEEQSNLFVTDMDDSRTRWGQPREIPRQGTEAMAAGPLSAFCAREALLSSSLPPVSTLFFNPNQFSPFPNQMSPVSLPEDPLPQETGANKRSSTHQESIPAKRSTLQELLSHPLQQPSTSGYTRLSASAPSQMSFDQHWQEACRSGIQDLGRTQDMRTAIQDPTRAGLIFPGSSRVHSSVSISSVSSGDALSILDDSGDYSHDEGFDSELDFSDHDDFSDSGDEVGSQIRSPSPGHSKGDKKERFFWQYNVQAKGPKGQRLTLNPGASDPHFLNAVTDPVFSPGCHIQGIKHSGKARRGDGNDLTPSPRRLFHIGQELKRLNRLINDLTTAGDAPFQVRPRSRKEKNKLASRACRLKKKAQHEANKLKLHGLQVEHQQLMNAIVLVKDTMKQKLSSQENKCDMSSDVESLLEKNYNVEVAGCSADYVNKVIDKMAGGVPNGGIDL